MFTFKDKTNAEQLATTIMYAVNAHAMYIEGSKTLTEFKEAEAELARVIEVILGVK